ncbi:MAG: diacylglycerol kinase family protein, partial [Planctomycetota bacterium]
MLVNPYSGLLSSLKLCETIKKKLNYKNFEIITCITSGKEDFRRIINQTKWENTLLMLFGGDGSFNVVINEIIKGQIELKLLPIPSGTSNVYNYATQIKVENVIDRI